MPTVNFYLKKPEGDPPRSLIYLQMRYRGEKFVYSVGENVSPKDWDREKQEVKTRSQTTKDGKVHLNSLLGKLKEICLKTYNTEIANGKPTKETLRDPLDQYMERNISKGKSVSGKPTLMGLIQRFIDGEMGEKTSGTIKTYQTAKMHLDGFQETTGSTVDFDTVDLDFKFKYVKYLSKKRIIGKGADKKELIALSANSIVKEIKNIKTFMNMGVELGYTTNLAFKSKKFSVKGEETDAVYLTDKELRSLYDFDLSNYAPLQSVRDLFVFSSYVGLRYSDASTIKPENIITMEGKKFIKIITQKTKSLVIIPCNDIVLKIFKKYSHTHNHLPPSKELQPYNRDLKTLCKVAGLVETGRLASDLSKPLCDCIASHTARRNFATNYYLMGMDIRMIMAVTGHSTEKSFLKYIKVSREENAKRMDEYMMKNLSKNLLKAAV